MQDRQIERRCWPDYAARFKFLEVYEYNLNQKQVARLSKLGGPVNKRIAMII
jgi:hypothetical protein